MGALPDPASPAVGTPMRRPEAAPPLRAVPRRRTEPEPAPPPTTSAPPPAATTRTPRPEESTTPEPGPVSAGSGLDLDKVAALRTWAGEHLRPPDLVHQAAPGLKHLWEQAVKGDHLPDNRVLRAAEVVRLAVSLPVIAASVLLAWSLVSAARTAALLLGVAALWVVASTLLGAAAELF